MSMNDFYLFSSLTLEEQKRLEEISTLKKFSKNEILFYQGDKPKYLHFLTKGIVKLYKHDYKGNEITIHNLIGACFVAEIANYENIPFPANCSFEIDSEVLLIDYEIFEKEFFTNPHIVKIFINSLTKKIKVLENFINYNITVDSGTKVAKFLYENEDLLENLKQVKIAQILNLTPETFSRKLATLKKENIITREDGFIKIIDKEKLKDYIGE